MVLAAALIPHVDTLRHLARTDPSPRVRRRAQCLLTWTQVPTRSAAARVTQPSPKSRSRWRDRVLAQGREGLVDRDRPGRPSKMPAAGDALLETARDQLPTVHGYATACWPLADLQDLLARNGWSVARTTGERHLHQMGYVYRRPRPDLAHRQDADAVARAEAVLTALRKKGGLPMTDVTWSISTTATSIPIRPWLPSGSDEAYPS
jgi:transposase